MSYETSNILDRDMSETEKLKEQRKKEMSKNAERKNRMFGNNNAFPEPSAQQGLQARNPSEPTWNGYPFNTRVEIPVEMLTPNEENKNIVDVTDTERLATAIQKFGFRGSIEVYPHKTEPDLLEINAGERRYRAAIKAGLEKVPTIIYQRPDDATVIETLLSSNVNAREQTPLQRIKEIKTYKEKVIDPRIDKAVNVRRDNTMYLKQIADFFGLSRPTISRYLELGRLNDELLSLCDNNNFPYSRLAAAVTLSDEEQVELYTRICKELENDPDGIISSKKLETLIYNYKLDLKKADPSNKKQMAASVPVEEAEPPLDDAIGRGDVPEPFTYEPKAVPDNKEQSVFPETEPYEYDSFREDEPILNPPVVEEHVPDNPPYQEPVETTPREQKIDFTVSTIRNQLTQISESTFRAENSAEVIKSLEQIIKVATSIKTKLVNQ